jgi:trk system potassium uptake protein TrkA
MFRFNFQKKQNIAVLGLGGFGVSVVKALSEYKVNILACDQDEACLESVADFATHAMKVDVSDEAALATLGLGSFDVVIVATSGNFEASQIATMVAKERGAKRVIVKVSNARQKKIMESLGIDEVILPEYEIGVKIARSLVAPNVMDLFTESDAYSISEMKPQAAWVGKSIRDADVRQAAHVTILAVYRQGKINVPVAPDWVLAADDTLIVFSEHKGAGLTNR